MDGNPRHHRRPHHQPAKKPAKEIGPSELGTDCLHCLAARLAGWEKRQSAAWLPFIGTCVHERFEHLFNSRKDEFTVPDDDGENHGP